MQVKLLVSRVTATGAENRGDVVDVTNAEAVRMIAAGQAEPVRAVAPEHSNGRGKKAERAV